MSKQATCGASGKAARAARRAAVGEAPPRESVQGLRALEESLKLPVFRGAGEFDLGRFTGVPPELAAYPLVLQAEGTELVYTFDAQHEGTGIAALMRALDVSGLDFKDLQTRQSSLEDIFVSLVSERT